VICEQGLWDGSDVDWNERTTAPPGTLVNRPSRQFLSGSGLAFNQDRDVSCCNSFETTHDINHRGISAENEFHRLNGGL
jgi:hypothetical protein